MRIGGVASRAGVNVETLRYYERRGLLAEPGRGPNGHRRYDEETVRFVRAVKEAHRLGFTLEEIAEHARLTRRGNPRESIRVRLAEKIDEVDGRIASLRQVREELARVLGCACDSLDHCTCGAAYLARGGRDPELGPLLHVTNGESAGNSLRQTGLGGAVLSWQDVLHEGPVPAVPPEELRRARARFLSECGWGSERSAPRVVRAARPALPGGARLGPPRRALVRARPLRPAPARPGAGARGRGAPPRPVGADPGQRLPRAAPAGGARETLARAAAGRRGAAGARTGGVGGVRGPGARRAGRAFGARYLGPAVPRRGPSPAARGATRPRERPGADGAPAARNVA